MSTFTSCRELSDLMASDRLFAVFDVRERGEYNQCQIPGATSLPRSQIEFRISKLVPNSAVPIVVYDQADERAPLAADTLANLGYVDVSVLSGGLVGWRDAAYPTVSGVNVPSKAFGEKVYHERSIPEISAAELHQMQQEGKKLHILDMRTPEEYARFCIPGGINVPGGDLILCAEELRTSNTPVVINCAGRTRSIIGAAALQRLGLKNVRALKNGTMGWVLAGFDLEKNPTRMPPAPSPDRAQALALALRLAGEENISLISTPELRTILSSEKPGVSYLIDVRSEGEYQSGHIEKSISVPGGQAVQRADDFVAVRNAHVIFVSHDSARAVMAAYWYRQMGFPHVSVLRGGLRAWSDSGEQLITGAPDDEPLGFAAAKASVRYISAQELAHGLDGAALILDVGTSLEFESAHVPGARWVPRGWLEVEIPRRFTDRNQAIIVTCANGMQSIFAAQALHRIGFTDVSALSGGVQAWSAAGFSTERGLDPCLVEPKDVVLSPSIRGSKEEMQRYLDWELKLVR
jgi:rhodanese-related sulfurtransferase